MRQMRRVWLLQHWLSYDGPFARWGNLFWTHENPDALVHRDLPNLYKADSLERRYQNQQARSHGPFTTGLGEPVTEVEWKKRY